MMLRIWKSTLEAVNGYCDNMSPSQIFFFNTMLVIANQSLHHHHHFHPPHPHHPHPLDQVGLPLRREDGSCMAPSDTCNPLVTFLKKIDMYP